MILLFSLWPLKPWQLALALSGFLCVFSLVSFTSQRVLKPDLCFYMVCMKGYLTYTYERHARTHTHTHEHAHTHTHTFLQAALVPHFIDPLCFFSWTHIKGCVHSRALCSLKCSRAATDPQILTFKPSGGKREQQRREREGERWRWRGKMDRRTETDRGKCFCCGSGGCCQICDSGAEFALAECVFASCKCM